MLKETTWSWRSLNLLPSDNKSSALTYNPCRSTMLSLFVVCSAASPFGPSLTDHGLELDLSAYMCMSYMSYFKKVSKLWFKWLLKLQKGKMTFLVGIHCSCKDPKSQGLWEASVCLCQTTGKKLQSGYKTGLSWAEVCIERTC